MYLSKNTINTLNAKLQKISSSRPLKPGVVHKIRENFEIEMTYNSNAIEGNSLTLKETFWVINEGLTVKGKSLKDHIEAQNHKEALDFLYEIIDKNKRNLVSEHLIKQLHQLVIQGSHKDLSGGYRDGGVRIAGADHTPCSAIDIPQKMHELIQWVQKESKHTHPIELAALLHHKIAHIHPFWDGNGRTARLVMNIIIMQAGYPLSIILKNDRKRYYRVLSEADKGKYKNLCEFVAQSVIRSLNIYLQAFQSKKNTAQVHESLESLSKKTPYSATYLRKLAVGGKIEAFKLQRNWLSSEEALQKYIQSLKRK